MASAPSPGAPGLGSPTITNKDAQALYEYWAAQRDAAVVPARAVIDPTAISDLLPRVHSLDQRAGDSFVWRLMGTELAAFFGRDLTGQTFDPTASPRHDWRFLAAYAAIISQPCGAVIRCRAQTTGGCIAPLEILALPLLDDTGRATEILAHSQVLDLERRELPQFGSLIDLRIERCDFLDIGAGKSSSGAIWGTSIRKKEANSMKLYNFHASSTSFRVRIGLELKGLAYEYIPVRLAWKRGEHDTAEYGEFNPQRNVPVLVDGDTKVAQSIAILEYLEERHPSPPLLPPDASDRAWVRSLALHIACEVEPLISLRVERFLRNERGDDAPVFWAWLRHWIATGFDAIEAMLAAHTRTGTYCHGHDPTIADCLLVPQVYEAQHPVIDLDVSEWPNIFRVYSACAEHEAFLRAHPENQPDYEGCARH